MATVIETLREEHRNISLLLKALEYQIDIFAEDAGQPDYDVIGGIAAYFRDFPLRCHHPKEDIVFAHLVERLPKPALPIEDLPSEHRVMRQRARRFSEVVAALLNEAEIARSTVVDAARDFIAAERRHMQMEETGLLPLAEQHLTAADWTAIEGQLSQREDPLFGTKVARQFHDLAERLLAWQREDEAGPPRR